MRPAAVSYLSCPNCEAPLALGQAGPEIDGHIMAGELVCTKSSCRYTIDEGVPLLVQSSVDPEKVETAQRFAEEWTRWNELRAYYEAQFLGWIAPVSGDDFRGKLVLEGGCGKGRHTSVIAGFGAAAVVAIDLGQAAHVAFRNTRHLPNAHVVIGDLLRPPVRPVFDLGVSVGVIHHLPEPAAGFRSLASRVRHGGKVSIWVYGHENNEWIPRYVDPVRTAVTARLPPATLRALSAVPAAALWAAIKTVYRNEVPDSIRGKLPYAEYFGSMGKFPFDEIHSIVFDQLVTPVAYYLRGDEVRDWFREGFSASAVRWHNNYSWSAVGTIDRPAT